MAEPLGWAGRPDQRSFRRQVRPSRWTAGTPDTGRHAQAFGYSATERASDSIGSLAVSPKGVALCFSYGATLPDPEGLLRAAIANARTPLPAG